MTVFKAKHQRLHVPPLPGPSSTHARVYWGSLSLRKFNRLTKPCITLVAICSSMLAKVKSLTTNTADNKSLPSLSSYLKLFPPSGLGAVLKCGEVSTWTSIRSKKKVSLDHTRRCSPTSKKKITATPKVIRASMFIVLLIGTGRGITSTTHMYRK